MPTDVNVVNSITVQGQVNVAPSHFWTVSGPYGSIDIYGTVTFGELLLAFLLSVFIVLMVVRIFQGALR